MKKKIFLVIFTMSIFTLMCISCKSAPAKETSSPEQATPTAVTASRAKAENARKQAMDFDSNKYFPSEWESAEAQFNAADDSDKLNAVTDVYNDLFQKAIPLYAQAKEDELMSVRDQLIATGFTEVFPQYLRRADDLTLAAQEKYEAKDYYGAKETADAALGEYKTLLTGSKVYTTRQEIINRGFTRFDTDNFLKADEVSQKAIDAYDAGDRDTAYANAEEALLRYNLALLNGWTTFASEHKAAAENERQLAIAERANIASRDTFRRGDALLESANEFLAEESYSDAALTFIEAEAVFAVSRKETEEKRIRAEEAIRMAEEKIEESSGSALEAEKLIEGGSR